MANPRRVGPRTGIIFPLDGSVWNADGDANWQNLEDNFALLTDIPIDLGYVSSAGLGLTLSISSGAVLVAGVISGYAGGTLTMVDATTNYVYLDPASSYQPASNTTGFPTGAIPLSQVVTSGGAISTVTDERPNYVVAFGNVPANQVIAGPASGGSGVAAARALVAADLPVMVGDSGTGGTKGAVPAPSAGDAAAGKFLKADGTFAVPGATGGGGVNLQSGTSYTVIAGDDKKLISANNASGVVINLPAASSLGSSFACAIENRGTGTLSIVPASGTIDGGSSFQLAQNQGCFIYSDGTNWYTLRGSGAAPAAGGGNFADSETPGGTIGAGNTAFTLAHLPSPAASLKLYLNGQRLTAGAGADYTLSGSNITMASAPASGDVLIADYRY